MTERVVTRDGRPMPDYRGLLKTLEATQYLVDSTGQVILTAGEATRIRALGFPTADHGPWQVPALPYALVADTWLEYLSLGWDASVEWSWDTAWAGDGPAGADPDDAIADPPPAPALVLADHSPTGGVEGPWAEPGDRAGGPCVSRASRLTVPIMRAATVSPAQERTNHARLSTARNRWDFLFLRVVPQIRRTPEQPGQYTGLLGSAFTVHLPEVIDLADLWGAVRQFVRAWRPARSRPPWARVQAEALLREWERLGAQSNSQ